ncbi:MAG: porin family protein [Paramuribaculum sp.]|nr:porin family protein [Paramuribaculum sp.]
MPFKNSIRTFSVLLAISLCGTLSHAASLYKGEKSVGLRGGFTTRNTTETAGLYFSYRFSDHFRISPKLDYAFRHKDIDAFSIDFDVEIPFSISTSGRTNIYPIAGLNYSSFSRHLSSNHPDKSDNSSQRESGLGLSLGAGVEYFATPSLRLAFEGKGILIRKYSGGWFNLSIGYVF